MHCVLPTRFLSCLPKLTATDMRLYLVLLTKRTPDAEVVHVRKSDLARQVDRSPRSVSRSLSQLLGLGLVRPTTKPDRDGRFQCELVTHVPNGDTAQHGQDTSVKQKVTPVSSGQDRTQMSPLKKSAEVRENMQLMDNKRQTEGTAVSHKTTPPPAPPPRNAINILKPEKGREGDTGERNQMSQPIPFKPQNATDLLALDIARAFNDEHHLPTYRFFCDQYDETGVRRAFSEAKSIPDHKIKKSKSALFIYLIRKYAKPKNKNPRH